MSRMLKAISIVCLLSLVSCIGRIDPRAKDLVALRTVRVSADAAFSVYYQQRSETIRAKLKSKTATIYTYLDQMHELNKVQVKVVELIKHIDRMLLLVYSQIQSGDSNESTLLYLNELVHRLVKIVTDLGIQIHDR